MDVESDGKNSAAAEENGDEDAATLNSSDVNEVDDDDGVPAPDTSEADVPAPDTEAADVVDVQDEEDNGVVEDAADKEVSEIMERAESDSDIEMVEEVKKDDDGDDVEIDDEEDDDEVQEVIDDDEDGAAAGEEGQEVVELSDSEDSPNPAVEDVTAEVDDTVRVPSSGSSEDEDEEEDLVGDPNREPGADATRYIEPAHLVPFRFGWRREVVMRKIGIGSVTSTQCDIYYIPPANQRYRTREANRKRRSKSDQEKYFEDFPHDEMSIVNFSYVRRPLELNNPAYELVRKAKQDERAAGFHTPGVPRRKPSSAIMGYKEPEESAGLMDGGSSDEDDDRIEFKEGFDLDLPLTAQAKKNLMGLRAEHKKRRKVRDAETCCTPPLAEDMLWSRVDEDPLGVYNALGGRSSPSTPPPLRAVKLTPVGTADRIAEAFQAVMDEAAKAPMTKEQEMKENVASHDAAITKFKDYVWKPPSKRKYCHDPTSLAESSRVLSQYMQLGKGMSPSPSSSSAFAGGRSSLRGGLSSAAAAAAAAAAAMMVKVKLPMQSINGKRPVVELVIEQNGRYQPIKFSNQMQVTESIPKSKFDEANRLRRTCYLKATQVPRVNGKPLLLAVNPSAAAAHRLNAMAAQHKYQMHMQQQQRHRIMAPSLQQQQQRFGGAGQPKYPSHLFNNSGARRMSSGTSSESSSSSFSPSGSRPPPGATAAPNTGEQVSILVRPTKGTNPKPVLLNVPRKVALKVKPGTTLSFSASSDQKYTVIDSKIHPPVKMTNGGKKPAPSTPPSSHAFGNGRRLPPAHGSPLSSRLGMAAANTLDRRRNQMLQQRQQHSTSSLRLQASLPKGVSIRPLGKPSSTSTFGLGGASLQRIRPGGGISSPHAPGKAVVPTRPGPSALSSGEVVSGPTTSAMTPCTPYCPGVSGFPELECNGCQSLFHSKCVGISPHIVDKIKRSFRCRVCLANAAPRSLQGRGLGQRSKNPPQVIDLD